MIHINIVVSINKSQNAFIRKKTVLSLSILLVIQPHVCNILNVPIVNDTITVKSILDYYTRNVFMRWLVCTTSYLNISVLIQITHISDICSKFRAYSMIYKLQNNECRHQSYYRCT